MLNINHLELPLLILLNRKDFWIRAKECLGQIIIKLLTSQVSMGKLSMYCLIIGVVEAEHLLMIKEFVS